MTTPRRPSFSIWDHLDRSETAKILRGERLSSCAPRKHTAKHFNRGPNVPSKLMLRKKTRHLEERQGAPRVSGEISRLAPTPAIRAKIDGERSLRLRSHSARDKPRNALQAIIRSLARWPNF